MPEIDPEAPFPFPGPGFPHDPFPFPKPLPGIFPPTRKDGGVHLGPPPGFTEALGSAKYSVSRVGSTIFVRAEGTLGYSAQIADLTYDSRLIYPPQLRFVVYTPGTPILTITRPFNFVEPFGFPEGPDVVVIHDATGAHSVPIVNPVTAAVTSQMFAKAADAKTTAMGKGKSLQEAFDNAVKALPSHSDVADDLLKYRVVESGLLKGTIAGIELYFAIVEFQSGASLSPPGEKP